MIERMASTLAAPVTPAGRFVKYWLPVLLMIGLMYYASTDVFSGENTRSIVEQLLLWLTGSATRGEIRRLNFLVRKTAHFTEYAVLAYLLFRAFRAESPIRWRLRWALYALAVCVAWSLIDEFHQTLTHTRGGTIYDSLLDSTGALFALCAAGCYSVWRQRARRSVT
jgi:VanZ family protein